MKFSCYQKYLLGFWLSKKALVKVGISISDGIVFVFNIA